jgi:glycosyltransferase involved in cell wall biosynthesis
MGYALYEQYVKEHGHPDVIHVHSMLNAGLVAQYINARHRIPFIITEHSSAFARKSLTAGQLLLCRGIANRAVRRFAVSFPFCHLLAEVLGDNGMKWEEMPNIVSEEFLTLPFAPSTDDTGIFKFVTVCLLTQKKGTHILLQAFAQVFRNDPFVTLDIGGDGPERSKLESLAHALGIRNQVRFVGMLSRSQVMDTMAGADAFVLASFYETFGVVFVEALALGKPVIATRCGGPESIVRSEDGLLVPANDVEALGEAMKQMRSKSGSYQRDVIRANCADRYGQASIIKRLSKVYEDVSHNVSRA